MSAITKKKLSEAEYLVIERAAKFKSEFYNGEMFAMAGASHQHNEISVNLIYRISGVVQKAPLLGNSSGYVRTLIVPS